jgi:hypothetical protein
MAMANGMRASVKGLPFSFSVASRSSLALEAEFHGLWTLMDLANMSGMDLYYDRDMVHLAGVHD